MQNRTQEVARDRVGIGSVVGFYNYVHNMLFFFFFVLHLMKFSRAAIVENQRIK